MLAVLALAGPAGVARDRLAEMFWGELADERARHSLRQLLSTLRREADLLRASGELLSIDAERCGCDATEFLACAASDDPAALSRADALYAGLLLEGVPPLGEGFERWLRAERARLADLARSALFRTAACHEAEGDHEAAAAAARRQLARDPADEEAHRIVMRAFAALGRRNAALEQFRLCREALARELGAEPEPATRALHERIVEAGREADGPSRLPCIGVGPIASLVRSPDVEALATSVAEDLGAHLARMPGFEVRAQPAAAARYLVTGSLRQPEPAQLRIAIQIVDGETTQYLWSARQDLRFPSAQKELDEFLAAMAARIEQQIILAEARLCPKDARQDAWAKIRQGSSALLTSGWSEEAVESAVAAYREAIVLDPALAMARAQKALIMALASRWGLLRGAAVREEARADADRALEIEPTRSEVLGIAACAIADLGDPERALPLLERAVEENPDNAQAWAALGSTQLLRRRFEAGVEALRRGLRISPLDYRRALWLTALAGGLTRLNRLEEALEAAQGACRSDANFYPARIVLGLVQARSGRPAEAAKALAEAKRLRPRLAMAEVRLWAGRSLDAVAHPLGLEGADPRAA